MIRTLIADKRLLRLTFNTNGWKTPIKHKWKIANQGTGGAFENQYGFGFEEWLFNDIFFFDGYQYGVIRGAEDLKNRYTAIREAYFFTINQKTHQRFLVGTIHNLELISSVSLVRKIADTLFNEALPIMREDLKGTEADLRGLDKLEHLCVRFRPEDVFMFSEMILSDELSSRKFLRFIPYKVEGKLEDFLTKHAPKDQFRFRERRVKSGGSNEKTVVGGTYTVESPHVRIIDQLEHFLKSDRNPFPGKLEVEGCKFGWHTADLVVAHDDGSYTIFEVKTSANIRFNIREGLGQLVDYACWYPDINIRRLVLVSPEKLCRSHSGYFKRVQEAISIKTYYWQFDEDNSTFAF